MIAIDALPALPAKAPESDSVTVTPLNDEEQDHVGYLDSQVEAQAARTRPGDLFSINLSLDTTSIRVVSSLKQLWEAGGWIVGALRVAETVMQMIFVRPKAWLMAPNALTEALKVREDAAPAVQQPRAASTKMPRMSRDILVRMPTRGRPEQAIAALRAYREMADKHVAIEAIIDEDDASMVSTEVLQQMCDLDCVITVGKHKSKIEAVNAGRVDDYAILILASDDMMPVVQGYDQRIVAAMDRHFPLRDGALNFNDGYNKNHVRDGEPVLCTLPVLGRYLVENFGYVYHPEYGSLYCDDEQTKLLTSMGRMVFVDELLIEHRHHAAGKAVCDALYQFNDNKWGAADRALFEQRSQMRRPGSQFAFDAPEMVLSILICSTTARRASFNRLTEFLRAQMRAFPRQVEIVADIDDGQKSIGDKRNELLARAVGKYVAFVDDDDWVDHVYVERILNALRDNPGVDCLSLTGVITTNGQNAAPFYHSLKYDHWFDEGGAHFRNPNHLNAVKRELAVAAGFPSKNFGEDHQYSKALQPLLKTEASTGETPLYFYWYRSK